MTKISKIILLPLTFIFLYLVETLLLYFMVCIENSITYKLNVSIYVNWVWFQTIIDVRILFFIIPDVLLYLLLNLILKLNTYIRFTIFHVLSFVFIVIFYNILIAHSNIDTILDFLVKKITYYSIASTIISPFFLFKIKKFTYFRSKS